MLDFIESPDNVLAVTVSGTVTEADLDAIMNRLDHMLATQDTIHIFTETRQIDGITISGLPSHLSRALPLMGKLSRFGRVAVVADQAWMRAATRLESALLPNISYRVVEPAEREAALAWVLHG
ncbi:MAG: STAS/SEC14 domain-containing protein [Croceibacterium sp.]